MKSLYSRFCPVQAQRAQYVLEELQFCGGKRYADRAFFQNMQRRFGLDGGSVEAAIIDLANARLIHARPIGPDLIVLEQRGGA